MISSTAISYILMGVAFLVTTLVYPHVLNFARRHNIVDNPNARKLQRVPVPVMGGTTVFIGLVVSVVVGYFLLHDARLVKILAPLTVMYIIGVWDDIKDISAAFRFFVELSVVWFIILFLGVEVNDFHELWGVNGIPDAVSIPLSLVIGVGIMNAINMIDGVDGYCSTYCMMACASFAAIFFFVGDIPMFALALIGAGSMAPFFFHNVFGRTSKMFLGDGGSLMIGTLLGYFVFSTLSSDSLASTISDDGLSLVALCLAILAVPVFDTLKVMIFRVVNGYSPFHPDKTHLHHLFIEMSFSHLTTSAFIVLMNGAIIGILLLSWYLGASVTLQVYVVIALALAFTWGFYFFMEAQHRKNDGDGTVLFKSFCKFGIKTNLTSSKGWLFIRRVVDSGLLGGKLYEKDSPVKPYTRPDPRIP